MRIAAFDLDGTLTTKDTLFDVIIFGFGKRRLVKGLFFLFPTLFLHKISIVSNHKAKERLFTYFFGGMGITEYEDMCVRYAERLDQILNPAVINRLLMHQQQGDTTLVVSASIQDWIIPWAKKHQIDDVIATRAEIINNKVTGRFSSKNCYGAEKVNRLLAAYPDRGTYQLYAYGDSRGDRELLAFADRGFYRSTE